MTIALKRNVPGYYDEQGRFRPIRVPQYVGSGTRKRPAKLRDRKKYSRAKAGDLGKVRQERALEAPWDREYRLEQESKAAEAKDRARIEREIAADTYGETSGRMSGGKPMSLAQFVRSAGGINTKARMRRGVKKFGDLENFTLKGSGSTGLVTTKPGKGKSLDYMHQAAREAGYDIADMDDLLNRLDDEIRSGQKTYSTHGSLAYNPAAKQNGVWHLSASKGKFNYLVNIAKKGNAHADYGLFLRADSSAVAVSRSKTEYKRQFSFLSANRLAEHMKDLTFKAERTKGKYTKNPIKILKHKFYVGQKLATRMITDNDIVVRGEVVSRTPKFVTVKIEGERTPKRCGVSVWSDAETIFPDGRYSMATSFNAKDDDRGRVRNPADGDAKRVAVTILQQLGGNKFIAMTGAKNFGAMKNGMAFRIPRSNGINAVRIELTGADLYDVTYLRLHGTSLKTVSVSKGLYADMLRSDFTRHTGLYTSLGTMGNPKTNPDAITMFAGLAGGIASALSIKEHMERPTKRKPARKRGTTTAKRRNPAGTQAASLHAGKAAHVPTRNPKSQSANRKSKGELYVLTIGSGDDLISVYLHDGDKDGFSKRFKSMAAAKAYATKQKRKLVANPQRGKIARKRNVEGFVDGAGVFHPIRGSADYSPSAAGDRKSAPRRRADSKRNLISAAKKATTQSQFSSAVTKLAKLAETTTGQALKLTGTYKGKRTTPIARRKKANPSIKNTAAVAAFLERVGGMSKGKASTTAKDIALLYKGEDPHRIVKSGNRLVVRKAKSRKRANPVKVKAHSTHRRTYESFQGRPSKKVYVEVPVSAHAPARLDQLGDLVELKINGGPTLKFSKGVKLCAANGRLWIAGKRFAKANPTAAANEINPIGEIGHVVYGTHKPHHGDHNFTHYIHKLGEESGVRPVLCVDRDGFPVIKGGNYKIEARGIVD